MTCRFRRRTFSTKRIWKIDSTSRRRARLSSPSRRDSEEYAGGEPRSSRGSILGLASACLLCEICGASAPYRRRPCQLAIHPLNPAIPEIAWRCAVFGPFPILSPKRVGGVECSHQLAIAQHLHARNRLATLHRQLELSRNARGFTSHEVAVAGKPHATMHARRAVAGARAKRLVKRLAC